MPKGTRKSSRVSTAMATRRATNSKGKPAKSNDSTVRNLVGSQGLSKVKGAEASGNRAFAYSTDEQRTPNKAKADKSKAAAFVKAKAKKAATSAVKKLKRKK